MWDMWQEKGKNTPLTLQRASPVKIGWKESNLHQPDSRCEERGLAVWLWKYVLCGISQSVFSYTAGIGSTGTKGNE